ncbi:MAG: histidinol phosphate phosphatase domain-containing protein [Nitrospirae bacterium]|nr:MAG: histidinol phosphate phosphatase domain-containing protein [Nitrospirota bacterium]
MIDLHSHTVFSDGELIPAELVRRALVKGLRAIAITDHMDGSNMDFIIPRIVKIADELNQLLPIKVIPGTELTHVPPELIPEKIKYARQLGAKIVVIHGETIVEPVKEGTNRAGILGGADIIAHPGLITEEDVKLAAQRGVCLEITARKGHSLSNGHVAKLALKHNAPLVINTDAHSPSDLIDRAFAEKILLSAGLDNNGVNQVFSNAEGLIARV